MPIIKQYATPPPQIPESLTCFNCGEPIEPCGCQPCKFPFNGYIHTSLLSHLCPQKEDK